MKASLPPEALVRNHVLGRRHGLQAEPRNLIRDAFVTSLEASTIVDPIVRLYEVAFGRQADEGGLTNWVNAIRGGIALETIAQGFTGSQEFINRFGTSTDRSAFVESLYVNGLGRASDAGGKALWVNSTLTDGQLLLGFSNSAESIARLDDFTTVLLTNLSDEIPPSSFDSLTAVIAGQIGSTVRRSHERDWQRGPSGNGALAQQ